jgi:hypothetical protein
MSGVLDSARLLRFADAGNTDAVHSENRSGMIASGAAQEAHPWAVLERDDQPAVVFLLVDPAVAVERLGETRLDQVDRREPDLYTAMGAIAAGKRATAAVSDSSR